MDDEFFVTKVYTTACTAVLLWDTVLTTRREYRALWRKQSGAHIGLKEVMYCFSRYGALATMVVTMALTFREMDDAICKSVHRLVPYFMTVFLAFANFTLGQRVFGLYGSAKWVAAFLGALAIAQFVLQVIIPVHNTFLRAPPALINGGCFSVPSDANNSYFALFWVAPLLYHAALFGLVAAKRFSAQNVSKEPVLSFSTLCASQTSILYYAVLLITSIVNVSWENTHTELQLRNRNANLTFIMSSMMASRVFQDLYKASFDTLTTLSHSQSRASARSNDKATFKNRFGFKGFGGAQAQVAGRSQLSSGTGVDSIGPHPQAVELPMAVLTSPNGTRNSVGAGSASDGKDWHYADDTMAGSDDELKGGGGKSSPPKVKVTQDGQPRLPPYMNTGSRPGTAGEATGVSFYPGVQVVSEVVRVTESTDAEDDLALSRQNRYT